jgi:hypothetical protein
MDGVEFVAVVSVVSVRDLLDALSRRPSAAEQLCLRLVVLLIRGRVRECLPHGPAFSGRPPPRAGVPPVSALPRTPAQTPPVALAPPALSGEARTSHLRPPSELLGGRSRPRDARSRKSAHVPSRFAPRRGSSRFARIIPSGWNSEFRESSKSLGMIQELARFESTHVSRGVRIRGRAVGSCGCLRRRSGR